jgi:hypothetical protein
MNAIRLVVVVTLLLATQVARSGTCPTSTIGRDPSAADTVVVEYLSRCVGQVFTTQDTLLVSLTIWRPALPALDSAPRHLFIVDVDSTGTPIPTSVIVDGGSIVNFTGDGTHPVPYRFQFDPPAVLPHRGRYCSVVPFDACDNGIAIMASDDDPYAGGRVWSVRTNNFANCVYPSGIASPMNALIDIVFQAEFCNATLAVGPPLLPPRLALALASGNPSRSGETALWRVSLPAEATVTLEAFDLAGRRVANSEPRTLPAGDSVIPWNAAPIGPGGYFVRASALGGHSRVVHMFVGH